jgi:anti-anti-sigma factor
MTMLSPAFPLSWASELLEGTHTALVTVEGELDRHTAPALGDHLQWLLAGDPVRILLDTEAVSFADAGALDMLERVGVAARQRDCAIVVMAPGAALQRLVEIVGVPAGVAFEAW